MSGAWSGLYSRGGRHVVRAQATWPRSDTAGDIVSSALFGDAPAGAITLLPSAVVNVSTFGAPLLAQRVHSTLYVDPDTAGGESVNQRLRTNVVLNASTFGAAVVEVVAAVPEPVARRRGRVLQSQRYWRDERREKAAAARQAADDVADMNDLADVLEALRSVA